MSKWDAIVEFLGSLMAMGGFVVLFTLFTGSPNNTPIHQFFLIFPYL